MVTYLKRQYRLFRTTEYEAWFDEQSPKSKNQIKNRLLKIEFEGYFGTQRNVTDFIIELKWLNGRRVYYAYIAEFAILILLGGNKNGQKQDIRQAEKIFKKYHEAES